MTYLHRFNQFKINTVNDFLRVAFVVLLASQIVGCASPGIDTSPDIAGLYSGKKGVIIIQGAHKNQGSSSEKHTLNTMWTNIENHKSFFVDPGNLPADLLCFLCPRGTFNYKTMVYFIEPGKYYLSWIYFYVGNYYYKANLSTNILNFEIKGGEVLYLGKITVSDKVKIVTNSINIENDYNTAVKYFKKKYPTITKVPEERLLQFSKKAQIFRKISKEYGVFD